MKELITDAKIWDTTLFQKWQNIKEHLNGTQRPGHNQTKIRVIHWLRCNRLKCDKNTLGNHPEHLVKGLRNISRHLHPPITTSQAQATAHE